MPVLTLCVFSATIVISMIEQTQPNPHNPEIKETTPDEQLRATLENIAPDAEYVPIPDSEYDPNDTSTHHVLYPVDSKGNTQRGNKVTVISAANRWNVIDQSDKGAQLYWVSKENGTVMAMDQHPDLSAALKVRFEADGEALQMYLNDLLERSTDQKPPSVLGKVLQRFTSRPE